MKMRRISEIATVFAEEGLGYLFGTAVLHEAVGDNGVQNQTPPQPKSDVETAARLRRTLERLGPTFVKFGQLLATRVDLFPDEFTNELSKLHSSVPPVPNDIAFKIIQEELGRPIADLFSDVSQNPIASASIAQVYRAKLISNGQSVALKVQRPNLEKNLIQDLEILLEISGWIDSLVPTYHKSMIHSVAKEYAHRSHMEIQFLSEATAMERFGEFFAGDAYFHIPKVHRELCTDKLIVMEWVDGDMLDKVQSANELTRRGFAPNELAKNLLRLQLCMSYEHGFIHADTHPGNLVLMPIGKIAIIDFGLHASISKAVRSKMLEMLILQSQGLIDEQVDAFAEFSPPGNPKDIEPYKAELRVLFKTSGPTSGPVISQQLISGMRIGAKYHNLANSELIMVVRNLLIIEGIILKFEPAFEPGKEMTGVLGDILKRKLSYQSLRDQATPLLGQIAFTLSRRPELMERLMKMERSFGASKNLGDFLRKEGVIQDHPPVRPAWVSQLALFILGIIAAVVWLKFLK